MENVGAAAAAAAGVTCSPVPWTKAGQHSAAVGIGWPLRRARISRTADTLARHLPCQSCSRSESREDAEHWDAMHSWAALAQGTQADRAPALSHACTHHPLTCHPHQRRELEGRADSGTKGKRNCRRIFSARELSQSRKISQNYTALPIYYFIPFYFSCFVCSCKTRETVVERQPACTGKGRGKAKGKKASGSRCPFGSLATQGRTHQHTPQHTTAAAMSMQIFVRLHSARLASPPRCCSPCRRCGREALRIFSRLSWPQPLQLHVSSIAQRTQLAAVPSVAMRWRVLGASCGWRCPLLLPSPVALPSSLSVRCCQLTDPSRSSVVPVLLFAAVCV
jgi:hypothetical protein